MQSINMIIIYYWDKKLKKRRKIACSGSWYNKKKKKKIDLMSLAQRMQFLQGVFQMIANELVSVINHHIYRLHLFWDTLYKGIIG